MRGMKNEVMGDVMLTYIKIKRKIIVS